MKTGPATRLRIYERWEKAKCRAYMQLGNSYVAWGTHYVIGEDGTAKIKTCFVKRV